MSCGKAGEYNVSGRRDDWVCYFAGLLIPTDISRPIATVAVFTADDSYMSGKRTIYIGGL